MTDNVERTLPERVRAERKSRGWTQTDLAERAGLSLRALQNFEAGHSTPQSAHLKGILRALDLDADGEATAAATREGFDESVKTFLDVVGIWLTAQPAEQRTEIMHELTRLIVTGNLSAMVRTPARR